MPVKQAVQTLLSLLLTVWRRVQVSQRGKCSIERLVALEEYSASISGLHTFLVYVLTPLPMLVILLALESIPLQDPSSGWKNNYGMWIRTGGAVIAGSCTIIDQMRQLVPGFTITATHMVLISVTTAISFVVLAMGLASVWVYPIPFIIIIMYGPFAVVLALSFSIFVARCSLHTILSSRQDRQLMVGYVRFLGAQVLLAIVYPAYNAAAVVLAKSGLEVVALLLLPVIRMVMRNVMAYCTSHLEDLIPEASIFTVELFSALYLASTMQHISSGYSVVVVLIVDATHLLVTMWSLRKDVDQLTDCTNQGSMATGVPTPIFSTEMLSQPGLHPDNRLLSRLRLRSCVHYKLSPAGASKLTAFERVGAYSPSKFRRGRLSRLLTTSASPLETSSRRLFAVQVRPLPGLKPQVLISSPSSRLTSRTSFAEQRALVDRLERRLQLIFRVEYVALAEYLECVVPVVYALLLSLMRQLPSVEFHPELGTLSTRAMSSMVLYWLMEVLSLLLLTVMLYRRGGVNVLHHVAFVLETHAALVQGKLITWMLIAFESQGTHFVPMLLIALGLECVPLQDPSEGWRVNCGFWIRSMLMAAIGNCAIVDQIRLMVPGTGVRGVQVFIISIVGAALYTAVTVAVAAVWTFPIPFMIAIMYGPSMVIVGSSFVVVVARCSLRRLHQIKVDRQMVVKYASFLIAQSVLGLVYPVYSVVFMHLASAGYEMAALLILPVVRLVMRNLMAHCIQHLEDLIPAAAIFSVELFNSLYLAATMQRVTSLSFVMVIMIIDAARVLLASYDLRSDVSKLLTLAPPVSSSEPPNKLFGILNHVTSGLSRTESTEHLFHIRLRSCIKHKLSPEAAERLARVDQGGAFASSKFTRQRTAFFAPTARHRPCTWGRASLLRVTAKVLPVGGVGRVIRPLLEATDLVNAKSTSPLRLQSQPSQLSPPDILQQLDRALHVAFTIEYTALSEYLEFVMPLLYVGYIVLVIKLPSRVYHLELEGISEASLHHSVSNNVLYGLMELASFVLLGVLLHRSIKLKVLHVVGFVLETQWSLVQGMLVMWMLIAQQFQLQHGGTDFTFDFEWVRTATSTDK